MSYFEALYFCYVSLLTIGYGDLSPRSNAGKPFFVVWSLVAVPTMTILISDMGDTVISAINRGTFTLADWTVMPKAGVWADFLNSHPKLRDWLERKTKDREARKRLEHGFELQNPDEESSIRGPSLPVIGGSEGGDTLENLASEKPNVTEHDLARKLALAIKKTAQDLHSPHPKRYSYEEWVEFTRLIRFSKFTEEVVEEAEEGEGLVEWDWIGEDSPMLAEVSESEWVLDRLCESLNRYTKRQAWSKRKRDSEESDSAVHLNSPKTPQHRFSKWDSTYPAHPGPRIPNHHSGQHYGTARSSSIVAKHFEDETAKERSVPGSQSSAEASGSTAVAGKEE